MRWLCLSVCVLAAACRPSLADYESRFHVVRPGETLYTIAWRYGVDYRTLARWNGLADPDLIVAGQRLNVRPVTSASPPVNRPRAALPPPVTLPAPAWQWPTTGDVAAAFGSRDGIASGIGISGRAGQPIVASADGRVVYAGTGLIGYGQLVIIKHNDTYLSAYGHTEQVHVRQGDTVSRGQPIAEMGIGPSRQPRLHFEIRRNGVPVDPLQYLPSAR